jgi:uncharacterized protein (DUF433 family)
MLDVPAYGIAEAARYIKLPPATLRSWVVGRSYPKRDGAGYFEPLIQLPQENNSLLSFANLVESYVLRALRQEHGVSIKDVRAALDYAQREYHISRLLLRNDLLTAAGELFLQRYGELISLSRSGQLALRKFFAAHLQRIDWDKELSSRLYPYFGVDDDKVIAIDPTIGFGRPVLIRKGISTSVITDRIDAGETVTELADDYDLSPAEIEMAVMYERAA